MLIVARTQPICAWLGCGTAFQSVFVVMQGRVCANTCSRGRSVFLQDFWHARELRVAAFVSKTGYQQQHVNDHSGPHFVALISQAFVSVSSPVWEPGLLGPGLRRRLPGCMYSLLYPALSNLKIRTVGASRLPLL